MHPIDITIKATFVCVIGGEVKLVVLFLKHSECPPNVEYAQNI